MFKKSTIVMIAAAFSFAVAPAFAQHTHAGAGGPHGPAMSNDAVDHSNANGSTKGTSSSPTNVLSKNSKLDSKLTSKLQSKGLLPAGTDLKDACAGFKNLGQCMAAIHVSHNLDVSFGCMRANMTGTSPAAGTTCAAGTGSSKLSLGKSIQALAPTADSKTASKTATTEADTDIKEAQTAS
jgi:hypothetical protein